MGVGMAHCRAKAATCEPMGRTMEYGHRKACRDGCPGGRNVIVSAIQETSMNKSMVLAAAVMGLAMGSVMVGCGSSQKSDDSGKSGCSGKAGCDGKSSCKSTDGDKASCKSDKASCKTK
jgi:hypothetical protein